MNERRSPALRAVSDAVLAVSSLYKADDSRVSVDEVLQGLVERARELAGARYAALGTPDGAGGFTRFLVAGMSDELISSLGPLPRTHGMLGAMLETEESFRTDDIQTDPRFQGWWPPGHPDMRSFLGVPIVSPSGGVTGAFYLTDKVDAERFDAADQELIEILAAHAGIAIVNARLYERSRELSTFEERNRLALELHDVVSQKLFSVVLTAEAAATLLARDPEAAAAKVARTGELARETLDELRSLVLELRPPDLDRDGLDGAVRKHVEVLRRVHGIEIDADLASAASAGVADRDREVLRIAQEALQNAIRHAAPERVTVRLAGEGGDGGGRLVLEVTDDGVGFEPADPELRSTRLGLTSMEERAGRIGGRLEIRSAPAAGTTVRLEVEGT